MTMTSVRESRDHQFELTSWSQDGISLLEVSASSVQHLLAVAMNGLLAALLSTQSTPETSGKSLRIRGEGADTAALLRSMANHLIEELDSLDVVPVDFVVEGMVRSETGLIAWGSVAISNNSPSGLCTIRHVEITNVTANPELHGARLRLYR